MESEIQTLQDIYSQFIRGMVPIDVAAQQVSEYTRLRKIPIGSLNFQEISDAERDKAVELLQYLLQPIEKQFFNGDVSAAEAARQMAPILSPHGSWGLMIDVASLSTSDQEKLEELYDHISLALADLEEHAEAK
jgi:hypothetical protein